MTAPRMEDGIPRTISSKTQENKSAVEGNNADFETAISGTGFGIFNLILTLVTMLPVLASQFETSSLSYVFPATRCDLNLTLEDRGLVNAIIYIGMIGSCFIWGSLVDVFGRKKIIIISLFIDSIFVLMATFAPNLSVLLVAKFFGGFVINGPAMALTPYLSEFHATQYRSRVALILGLLYNVGNIVLPLLAWAILPLDIKLSLFGGLEFHAWNLFLLISTLASFVGGIIFILLPESPKYLMSKGNNEQALQVFQKIYKINTKQEIDKYPVKTLMDEKQIYQKKYTVKEAWKQISPLFSLRYTTKLMLVCSLQFFLMMCLNSLRLWLPEIFQLMNDYQSGNETSSFCNILNTLQNTANTDEEKCSMNFNNASVYINCIVVAFCTIIGYFAASLCINKVGKKKILVILGLVGGTCEASLYFAPNSSTAIVLICLHLMCSGICIDVTIGAIVDLFPTHLRASALSLALMFGRIGSVVGNLTMPILLQTGCAVPFFTLGSMVIGAVVPLFRCSYQILTSKPWDKSASRFFE